MSQTKKQQIYSDLHEKWLVQAMEWYQADVTLQNIKKKSTNASEQAEDECYQKRIKLSPATLLQPINGGQSVQDFNAEKRWLTADKENKLANHSFPLSHKRLKEHVDEICWA